MLELIAQWLRRLFTFSRSPKGVLKAIGVGLVTLFLALLLIFGVFYAATPIPDPNSEFKTENTTLFYRDGKLIKSEPFFWRYNTLTPVVCGKKP